jgi:hypothetical protein
MDITRPEADHVDIDTYVDKLEAFAEAEDLHRDALAAIEADRGTYVERYGAEVRKQAAAIFAALDTDGGQALLALLAPSKRDALRRLFGEPSRQLALVPVPSPEVEPEPEAEEPERQGLRDRVYAPKRTVVTYSLADRPTRPRASTGQPERFYRSRAYRQFCDTVGLGTPDTFTTKAGRVRKACWLSQAEVELCREWLDARYRASGTP